MLNCGGMKLKEESSEKIKGLESRVKILAEELTKKEDEIAKLKADLQKKDQVTEKDKKALSSQKESLSKVKELESKVKEFTTELGQKEMDFQAWKKLLNERESELNGLRQEIQFSLPFLLPLFQVGRSSLQSIIYNSPSPS